MSIYDISTTYKLHEALNTLNFIKSDYSKVNLRFAGIHKFDATATWSRKNNNRYYLFRVLYADPRHNLFI